MLFRFLLLSPSGYLFITGRIKELLITRGGENIAPVPIENRMLDQMKLISNCMVVGDNQKYLTMLVTLRTEVCLTHDSITMVMTMLGPMCTQCALDPICIGRWI